MALINLESSSKNRYFYSQGFFNPLDTNKVPIDIIATGQYPSVEGIDITGWPRLSFYNYNGAVVPVGIKSILQINPTAIDDTKWVNFGSSIATLPTPSAPTISVQGTVGTTPYSYRIVALSSSGETLPSPAGTTAVGNANLSVTNFNRVTWAAIPDAISYNIFGNTTGGELFMINQTALSFDDIGSITPAGALPTINTSAQSNGTIEIARSFHRIRLNVTAITSGGIVMILSGSHS